MNNIPLDLLNKLHLINILFKDTDEPNLKQNHLFDK